MTGDRAINERPDGVVVSRWDAGRLDAIEPLWRSLVAHHASLAAVPPVRTAEEAWQRRRAQYEQWLTGGEGTLFVAEIAGKPQGYLMLTISEGTPTWNIGDRAAEIETLAVLPAARGKGVGTALIEAALDFAETRGATATAVGVAHSNDGAIRFYERQGFQPFYVQLLRTPRPQDSAPQH